jgi:hypothetical protein
MAGAKAVSRKISMSSHARRRRNTEEVTRELPWVRAGFLTHRTRIALPPV